MFGKEKKNSEKKQTPNKKNDRERVKKNEWLSQSVFFFLFGVQKMQKLSNYQTNTLIFKQKKTLRVRETQLEGHVFFNPFKSH